MHVSSGEAKAVDDTRFELVQPDPDIAIAIQLQRTFEIGPDRIKRTVDKEWRALKQVGSALVAARALAQRTSRPALSDAGFPAQQDRPPGLFLCYMNQNTTHGVFFRFGP